MRATVRGQDGVGWHRKMIMWYLLFTAMVRIQWARGQYRAGREMRLRVHVSPR